MSGIIVDTSVWSLALRKKNLDDSQQKTVAALGEYIRMGKVIMLGAIRQEVLSGISDQNKFEHLRDVMHFFTDFPLSETDYELAASYFNLCRSHGIQGSHTDFLLCAVAVRNGFPIFSLDGDFSQYKNYIDFQLIQ